MAEKKYYNVYIEEDKDAICDKFKNSPSIVYDKGFNNGTFHPRLCIIAEIRKMISEGKTDFDIQWKLNDETIHDI